MRSINFSLGKKQAKILKKGMAYVLYLSDSIHTIFEACKSCYDIQREMSYEEIKNYIGRRVSAGHDSILEHSNLIFAIKCISTEYKADLGSLCSMRENPTKYLKILAKDTDDNETMNVVIGGTVRGFKHFISRYDYCQDNIFYNHILNLLYQSTVKEYWVDLEPVVEMNRFVSNLFEHDEQDFDPEDCNFCCSPDSKSDKFEIVNADSASYIRKELFELGFNDTEDVEQLGTITICFKNMSRTATHQLVRHRNGITQESQRYVDYSKAGFTVPDLSYLSSEEPKFDIKLGNQTLNVTAKELSEIMMSVYPQLREQGVKKEDARAFLPQNVQCKKLYMTFTYEHLAIFFDLRCDEHAQAEIRSYAWAIMERLKELDDERAKFALEMEKRFHDYCDTDESEDKKESEYEDIDELEDEELSKDVVDEIANRISCFMNTGDYNLFTPSSAIVYLLIGNDEDEDDEVEED